MVPYMKNFIRDELPLETWIAIGAFAQILLTLTTPLLTALAPITLFIIWRLVTLVLIRLKLLHDTSMDGVKIGRLTAQLPDSSGNFSKTGSDDQIVLFILGAKSNHILGRLAPGYQALRDHFVNMTTQLSQNPESSGCLGMTAPMLSTEEDTCNTLVAITYWKNIESLHAWAQTEAHRPAEIWWGQEKREHLGIFHETYVVPRGHWETIYHNFKPFGFGGLKTQVVGEDGARKTVGLLRETRGKEWRSMLERMGRSGGDEK